MGRRSLGIGIALVLVASAVSGCATASLVIDGSTVRVASSQPFTSFNDQTSFGNTVANTAIVAAANSGFTYYNSESELVRDESFGHYEVVSREPFTVRYTVAEGVTWSDGEAVDGADLLLAWAANSGQLNTEGFTPSRYVDGETGQFTPFPDDVVYFDGAYHSGLQHVSSLPELGDDGRSITLRYDSFFVDWQLAFDVGLPAHVVALEAFSITGSAERSAAARAKERVIDAITEGDTARLSRLAQAWNSAFAVGDTAPDTAILVGSGPYRVDEVVPGESVTLTANPLYTGERRPRFETVVVQTITDPLDAVAALEGDEVDVIAPSPTTDVVAALDGLDDVTVVETTSGAFEHLDLQFSSGKNPTFDDPLLREAFLLTVPREQILDELVRPVAPEAVLRDSQVLVDGGEAAPAVFDLSRARRLIAEAGVSAPAVCVLFDPSNPRRVSEYELIEASAEKAGFVVDNCSRSDWDSFLGVAGSYDAALFAWDETTAAVSAPSARLHSTSTVSNFSHYASEEVDGLLDELALTEDADKQRDLLIAIDEQLSADSYGVPLYQFPAIVAYDDDLQNIAPARFGSGLLWNVWAWQPRAEEGEPHSR